MWRNTFPSEPNGPRGMYFFEELRTANPVPEHARPYCCLVNTVIFHKLPLEIQHGRYIEFDRTETEWDLLGWKWTNQDIGWASLAPLVKHEGKFYELAGGHVVHKNGAWHMQWMAWRLPEDDYRLIELKRLRWDE